MNRIITAQALGGIMPQLLLNGGVLSLLILELGGTKFEVGAVYMVEFISQSVRILAAHHVDVVSKKKMVILWRLDSWAGAKPPTVSATGWSFWLTSSRCPCPSSS